MRRILTTNRHHDRTVEKEKMRWMMNRTAKSRLDCQAWKLVVGSASRPMIIYDWHPSLGPSLTLGQ